MQQNCNQRPAWCTSSVQTWHLPVKLRFRILQHAPEAVSCRGVGFKEGSLSLGPSVKVFLHVGTSMNVLLVPHLESLLSILFFLINTKDIPCAEGVNGLGLPQMTL